MFIVARATHEPSSARSGMPDSHVPLEGGFNRYGSRAIRVSLLTELGNRFCGTSLL